MWEAGLEYIRKCDWRVQSDVRCELSSARRIRQVVPMRIPIAGALLRLLSSLKPSLKDTLPST